jgi:capsular exopolysaccharide synthesis family protein
MSVRLTQSAPSGENLELAPYGRSLGPSGWPGAPESEGVAWTRYIDALKRHVLLILGVAVAGSALGLFLARRVQPVYEAQAKIWIDPGGSPQSGPIRTQQLLPATSWNELLRSYAIVDPVVRKLRLNIGYRQPADSRLFSNFESLPALRPGTYVLEIDSAGRYVLAGGKDTILERGVVGDSIGRKMGFGWAPDSRLLTPGRTISFSVSSVRNASVSLIKMVSVSSPEDGQFLTVKLSGSDPRRAAITLNVWVEQFVASADELKKRHLLEFKSILGDQLRVTESQLQAAEVQLERFRVNTITLPSGGSATGLAGQATSDPSIAGYFLQKGNLSEVQSERIALEQMIANAKGGPMDPQAFLTLPSILTDAPQLRAAIDELSSRQAALRTEQQFLTDANPRVTQLNETIRTLQYETIPRIAQSVVETLRIREQNLRARVETGSQELRQIPPRTIEELRLVRQVAASENLYGVLKARYEEVALMEAQTRPDLSVLDLAVPPVRPTSNDAPRLLFLAILASLGIAAAIALLHDRIDHRFRYPEQATHDLGLTIAGTVPRLRPSRSGDLQVELLSQVVESFRTLRLAVRYDFPADGPVVLAVSSPSAHDGKSLVSANLAMAFASSGHRTLLIDGDVRCGLLHGTFGVQATPGLVEYLGSGTDIDTVVKSTGTDNLFLVPRGTRAVNAPELLVSERMNGLIQVARQKFDVVIIDSPPFIAGVDAYALGAVAGSILVVLRQGMSDRKLAAAKLAVVDRLPIRVLGAVINGVPAGGMYRYYGTDYYYAGRTPANKINKLSSSRGLVVGA